MLEAAALSVFFCLLQADWALPLGGATVFHTELALLALALWAGPRLKGAWILAFSPLGLWLLLHAFGPGSPWEGAKGLLRAGEFALALALPGLLIRGKKPLSFVLRSVFFTGCLSCLWALAQSAAGPGSALNAGRGVEFIRGFQAAAAGMGHHNQWGAFSAAFICLALAAAAADEAKPWAWAALALGSLGLLASFSRGAWAGMALGSVFLFFLLPGRLRWPLLGMALVAAAIGLWGPWASFRGRLGSMGGDSDRAVHLRAAWGLWQGHAWWGWGSAGLAEQTRLVAAGLPLPEAARQSFSSHLHNSYLQYGLEWGWPVLALWALFLAWPFMRALRSGGPWGLALMGAMAAFLLQASTDLLTLHARGMAVAFCWGLMLAGLKLANREEHARPL